MSDKPLYAPGCFGFAAHSQDEVCTTCPYVTQCAPLAQAKVAQLRATYGFQTKPRRPFGQLAVKVMKLFEDLGKTADEVRAAMQAGVNPYSMRAGFVGLACAVLLNRKSTTRELIAAVMMRYRGYNQPTADVYARHAVQILEYCGVVKTDGNKVELVFQDAVQPDK
jgi:predicted nucleotide-binding protein (sugar kinase/HSP70/actin superfamily)